MTSSPAPAETEYADRVAELLSQFHPHSVPAERRVYANRNLRLESIDLIGFDMDHTLAVYEPAIDELQIRLAVEQLVAERGYPEQTLGFEYDPAFAIRGLMIDKRYGHLLKVDTHRHISRCFHGMRQLGKTERREIYRNERVRPSAHRFFLLDTLFLVAEGWLFARLVHARTDGGTRQLMPASYGRIFDDVRETMDRIHGGSALKEAVLGDVGRYVHRDDELPLMLHRYRSAGRRLFLMTNSDGPFTDAVMRHLLHGARPEYSRWQDYFDIIVVGACKPSFFAGDAPFRALRPDMRPAGDTPATSFEPATVYQGGNLNDFRKMVAAHDDRVLYVGDNLYGDILRSKKATTWRTAMIVPELEREMACVREHEADLLRRNELETHRSQVDAELHQQQELFRSLTEFSRGREGELSEEERSAFRHAIQVARRNVRRLDHALHRCLREIHDLNNVVDADLNANWGSLFKSRAEHSIFGEQVEDYACIYTSRATNLGLYSPFQYFRTPRDLLPHERVLPSPADQA